MEKTSGPSREHRFGPPVTVAATNRLARAILARHDVEMLQRGLAAWERPAVLPWQAWLRERFDELLVSGADQRCLLSPPAEALLWDSVVTGSDLPLIHPEGAGQSAQEAWRLLCDWGLESSVPEDWGTEEGRWLWRWIEDFLARCERLDVLDGPRLGAVVTRGFDAGHLPVPERLSLVGFDELTPAQERLVGALQRLGTAVDHAEPEPAEPDSLVRLALADGQAEIGLAVEWAVGRIAATEAATVAIVVPRLAEYRDAVLGCLEEALEPERLLSAERPRKALYNVSLGSPLAEAPLVHDALAWWRLASGRPQPLESLSLLLRSPFCAGAEDERGARALLDVEMRRRARPQMTLSSWVALCRRLSRASDPGVPVWTQALARLAERAGRVCVGCRSAGDWRRVLRDLLDAAGWPGQRGLDSHEHQQVEALGSVLDALSGLDAVRPDGFSYSEVLSRLERTLGETLFQPESAPDAPIQVMGPLEVAGQAFDALWVLGLDEAHWPVQAHPNPFLPYALQRDRGMPHASPARELEYARRLTRRLLGSGREVVVSYPLREGDAECTPSPLIADLRPVEPAALQAGLGAGRSLAQQLSAGTLERFDDDRGPALNASESIHGGSAVLSDQSACPFRGFARHRLGADAPEAVEPGLDAASFGSLVHRILELVWCDLGDSARLQALGGGELAPIVEGAVDTSLEQRRSRLPDVLTPGFTALLRERLIALVREWLEIEKQRAPFRVVAREQDEQVELTGLALSLKVDRIDALEDGSRIVLDYKTGKSGSAGSWDRDRLEEPQLPLYAVVVSGGLGGLALAKVRRDDHRGFQGVVTADGILPGRSVTRIDGGTEGMTARVERWRTQLEALAGELTGGQARVDPLPGACDYCGLDLLCRRRELEQAAGAVGEDEA
jgi:ATP-dependent helicase/nuclease subunit B